MKHSELKVGMKVKRVSYFNKKFYASIQGNISTVEHIDNKNFVFSAEEEKGCYFEAQYFEPVEETKEKETMNTESNLISMQCADKTISLDKKYKTRCGYPVRVLCIDRKDTVWPVVAMYQKENCEGVSFHKINDGTSWNGQDFDLVEVSPYEDFKKDDKVMVSRDGTKWIKRYFSHEENGVPYIFNNGNTSWSSRYSKAWEFCRKPTQEELGE